MDIHNYEAPPASKTFIGKERTSVLKLIIGMAVRGYLYEPNAARNTATAEIQSDLENLGIPLDRDTILKWLREASELLPASTED